LVVRVAVLGGTGKEGGGLAARWAHAGYDVTIGSREQAKAERVAAEVNKLLGHDTVRGLLNAEAAARADIAVLTVPYAAHRPTLEGLREALQSKILVDVTNPLQPPAINEVHLPEGGSAAQEAQAILGDGVRVVAAFHHVTHTHLRDITHPVESDVLVCGDDAQAKADVIRLATAAGMRGLDAGSLANAVALEAFTAVLMSINRHYGVKGSGIKISGLPATS
jgi:NADPH-dependent F420 reductase